VSQCDSLFFSTSSCLCLLTLACHTQEEIAAAVEVHQDTVSEWSKGFTEKLAADNSVNWTDFSPPIYNITPAGPPQVYGWAIG